MSKPKPDMDDFISSAKVIAPRITDIAIKSKSKYNLNSLRKINPDIRVRESEPVPTDKIYNREVNSIATDVVVYDFINTADKTYNFMIIICTLFNACVDYYCDLKHLKKPYMDEKGIKVPGDLFFMYKGGNVLRLIYYEFSKNLPVGPQDIAEEFFSKSFKKSDSDFSIVINPEIQNYDETYEDMIALSYFLQTIVRKLFNRTPGSDMYDVFAFTEYNSQKKDIILRTMLGALNSSESVKDPSNPDFYGAKFTKAVVMGHSFGLPEHNDQLSYDLKDKYADESMLDSNSSTRADFGIDICSSMTGKPSNSCIYPISKTTDDLYISINRSLDFMAGFTGSPMRVKFALIRTKLNCVTYMTRGSEHTKKLIGAEVIDCSITHRDATGFGTAADIEEFKHGISHFSLSAISKKYRLEFFGYNIHGMIHDLEQMMFAQNDVPWLDVKYAKRFNRLFFMYMVDLFIKVIDNDKRIEIIEKYRNFMLQLIQIVGQIGQISQADYISRIRGLTPLDSDGGKIVLNTSTPKFKVIAEKAYSMKDDLSKMISNIDENTRHMKEIFESTKQYINSEATYDDRVSRGRVGSMAGGNLAGGADEKCGLPTFPEYVAKIMKAIGGSRNNVQDNNTVNTESFDLSQITTDADAELANLEKLFEGLN